MIRDSSHKRCKAQTFVSHKEGINKKKKTKIVRSRLPNMTTCVTKRGEDREGSEEQRTKAAEHKIF